MIKRKRLHSSNWQGVISIFEYSRDESTQSIVYLYRIRLTAAKVTVSAHLFSLEELSSPCCASNTPKMTFSCPWLLQLYLFYLISTVPVLCPSNCVSVCYVLTVCLCCPLFLVFIYRFHHFTDTLSPETQTEMEQRTFLFDKWELYRTVIAVKKKKCIKPWPAFIWQTHSHTLGFLSLWGHSIGRMHP